jgi:hypothetical protein
VFLYGEMVQLAQFIGRILFSVVPFSQCGSSSAKPNYTARRLRGNIGSVTFFMVPAELKKIGR